MDPPTLDADDAAPNGASAWLVALNERPADAALLARHAAWLAADAANQRAWDETQAVWHLLAHTAAAHSTAAWADTRAHAPGAVRMRPAARPSRGAGLVGGALALAACLVLAVLSWLPHMPGADWRTGTGETRTLALRDGSTVVLGADSALAHEPAVGARRHALLHGEAYFTVAPDPTAPFSVTAGPVRATALGTAFEVRRNEAGVAVHVAHGSVEVAATARDGGPDRVLRLAAGDAVLVAADDRVTTSATNPDLVAAWRGGLLVARDEPVAAVLERLDRHFPGWIILGDAALGAAPLTGVYRLEDPRAALEAIAAAHGGRVYAVTPWVLVLSPAGRGAGLF